MVTTVTSVDEKHILQFNMYTAKKRLWFPFAAMAFLIIIGIVCCLDKDLGVVGGVVLMCVGLLMPPLYWVVMLYLVKKSVKNSTMIKSELVQTINFDDKICIAENNKFAKSNDIEYSWEALFKAVETRDNFYLYIDKVQAFIVGKDCFTAGEPQDLRYMLEQKLDKKFVCSKKYSKNIAKKVN